MSWTSRTCLALSVLAPTTLWAQDLSSPRKAFESRAKTNEELRAKFDSKMDKLFSMGSMSPDIYPLCSAKYVEFLKAGVERRAKRGKTKTLEERWVYERETKQSDGTVRVDAKRVRVRERKTRTGETKREEDVKKMRFTYKQVDDGWRISQREEPCSRCERRGKRPDKKCDCAGKGCPQCVSDKPNPKCRDCKGSGWTTKKFVDGIFFFAMYAIPAPKKVWDQSSAEGVVRSLRWHEMNAEHEGRQLLTKLGDAMIEFIKTYNLAETASELALAIKLGRENDQEAESKRKWRIVDSKQAGGSVVVATEELTYRGGKERKKTKQFRLLQENGKWKVDDTGDGCWSCKGSGVCSDCGGSDRARPCWSCYDKTVDMAKTPPNPDCRKCKGKGSDRQCWGCKRSGKKGVCGSCKGAGVRWSREDRRGKK